MKQKEILKIEVFFDRMHSDFDTIYTHNKSKRFAYFAVFFLFDFNCLLNIFLPG